MREVMTMSDLMTVEQVAEYLQVSTKWVYTEVKEGTLPGMKLGDRMWRFKKSALEAWLEQQ
jgi:excisionase family DNA binding protein